MYASISAARRFAQTTFVTRSISERQDHWVVWVGKIHLHTSDVDVSQRKLMCHCTDYHFPDDSKFLILTDVRAVCFGWPGTSAPSVFALLGKKQGEMISGGWCFENLRKFSQSECKCWCFQNWYWSLVKEKFVHDNWPCLRQWQKTLWVFVEGQFLKTHKPKNVLKRFIRTKYCTPTSWLEVLPSLAVLCAVQSPQLLVYTQAFVALGVHYKFTVVSFPYFYDWIEKTQNVSSSSS